MDPRLKQNHRIFFSGSGPTFMKTSDPVLVPLLVDSIQNDFSWSNCETLKFLEKGPWTRIISSR